MRAVLRISIVVMLAPGPAAFAQEATQPSGPTGFIAEPIVLGKLIDIFDGVVVRGEREDGPYAELGHMITGAGWISTGPGYSRRLLDGRGLVDASAAFSWNFYKVAQGRFELPHVAHDRLSLGGQVIYQDLLQVNYFGPGNDSLEADRSVYRLNNPDVLGYATVRAAAWLSVKGSFGWIKRPDLSTATGPHVDVPNTSDIFTEASAPGIQTPAPFLHADVSVVADWRDHPGHPTSGGRYRATAASYSDRDAGTYSFRRYELEASHFVPLLARNWVVALRAWEVFSDTSSGHVVPFYLLPSLGGHNTLRGYSDYRFHDNQLQSFSVESRFALLAHLDAAVFVDAGKVAARAGDLDFRHLKGSYGIGFRVHNATSTLGRLDIGHSGEGWRVFFRLSDPVERSTPAFGRSSVVPFVP